MARVRAFLDRKLFLSEHTINLSAAEAREWLAKSDNVQIIDVRAPESYEAGHLPGAVNVKYADGELDSNAVKQLGSDKPVSIHCDGGFRSRLAVPAVENAGFDTIRNLHRGIMEWKLKEGEAEKDRTRGDCPRSRKTKRCVDVAFLQKRIP